MSWQACKHVWNNSKQTGGLKLTLLAIAEHATEKNGWTCCASIETLAGMVGVSDRQIKKNLTKLEELGELQIDRNIGRGNTNIYNISCLIKGEPEDIKGELQDTFYDSEKVNHSTEKVNSRVIKGEPQFTQTNITKKEPKEYIRTGTATDDQIMPLIEALKKISKQTYTNGRHSEFDDIALTLYGWDATPKEVESFGIWWESNCWYKPPSKASLKTIVDEWQKFKRSPNSKNGHTNGINPPPVIKPQTADESAEFEALIRNSIEAK